MAEVVWTVASQRLQLDSSAVQVWRVGLALPQADVVLLREMLSDDELARADRFVFERDRNRFIVARARLRQILAAYTDVQPHDIGFGYSRYGKPFLSTPKTNLPVDFNVSHSGELALVAVASGRRVGIDLEEARDERAYMEIADSVFSTQERAALAALPAAHRRLGFYTVWTRKEAFIKAHGEGLSYPLDGFSVSVGADEPARLHLPDRADEVEWSLYGLAPGEGYVGALAVEGGAVGVCLYDLPPRW